MAACGRFLYDALAAQLYPLGGIRGAVHANASMLNACLRSEVVAGICLRNLVVFAGLASACQNPVEPPSFNVGLEISADTVWIQRSPNEVRFLVPVTIRNEDSRSLFVTPCAHTVQQQTADGWQPVWSSPCAPGRLFSLELSPGESTLLTLLMRASIQSSDWPASAKAGTYRSRDSCRAVPRHNRGLNSSAVRGLAHRSVGPLWSFNRVQCAQESRFTPSGRSRQGVRKPCPGDGMPSGQVRGGVGGRRAVAAA